MVFYEVVFYSATNVNSVKPRGRSSQPKRHRCYQIMQNPTGFDLGTIIRPNCLLRGGRGRKGASLIEFYVAVVGDLSMPKFITRRIIMPYKNWQSQIGPHTSSHSHHFTLSLFFCFGENETFVFDIGGKKINMNLETIVYVSLFSDKFICWFPWYEKLDI